MYQGGNSQHLSPWGCYWRSYEKILYYNTHTGWGAASCVYYSSWQYSCVRRAFPSNTVPQLENETCVECSAGQYSEEAGSQTCTSCEAGKFQSSEGTSECLLCAAGKYEPSEGQTECNELCPAGKYGKVTNDLRVSEATACEVCPQGKYEPSTGQTSCGFECPAGKYGADTDNPRTSESNACSDCDAGKYESSTGQTSCRFGCPKGKHGADTDDPRTSESNACSNCDAGLHQDETGKSSCKDCPAGTFSGPAATFCEGCTKGKASGKKASECTNCNSNTYSNVDNAYRCEYCSHSSRTPNFGAWTDCNICYWGRNCDACGYWESLRCNRFGFNCETIKNCNYCYISSDTDQATHAECNYRL